MPRLIVAVAMPSGLLSDGDSTDGPVLQAHLDQARDEIVPSLGATSYTITRERLMTQSQGEDALFNQTILRLPGVAQGCSCWR